MPSVPPRRRFLRRRAVFLSALALAVGIPAAFAGPALAFAAKTRVDLRVLVVSDGSATEDAITAQLDREGIPYDTLSASSTGRSKITDATLSATTGGVAEAKYQGIVLPNENALAADETAVVTGYEKKFGIRQLDAYTFAGPNVGETAAWSGTLDGTALTVTAAAKSAGFGYLNGTVPVDDRDPSVSESYGYLATAAPAAGATLTPLVTGSAGGTTGSLVAVYSHDGRDEMVVTMASNRNQTHGMLLAHGMVTWLTQGIHLGYWRNWFTMHVDDLFLPDDRWDSAHNCTPGDNCPAGVTGTTVRMTAADVDNLVAWQKKTGVKIDLAFNGGGSDDAGTGDPLTARVVADKAQLRFINHTYDHPYLGCVQNFTVSPWQCATANGQTQWVSQADITTAISKNVTWARNHGLSIDAQTVVTGEHSGLKTLPQMPTDNPNLAPALSAARITTVASDASRETAPRTVGPARTVPRHPMNIYYNVGRQSEEVDEYNWLYTSTADGGSGICTDNPASTCLAQPLTGSQFAGYIVPLEARIAFDHVVSADTDPHYAHQSNLAEDRILYPVLDAILAKYRAAFTTATPIVNPTYAQIATVQNQQTAWASAVRARTVEAYVQDGKVTVVNHGTGTLAVPVTAPTGTQSTSVALGLQVKTGAFGEAYGTERSAWTSLGRGATLNLVQPN